MCSPSTPSYTPPPVIKTANSAAAISPAEQLLKIKQASNNPNIATSPFGDMSPVSTNKKTLLGQ